MKNLKRIAICLITINLTGMGLALLAQTEYQSGVLILHDGRIIAMRGDYEQMGDEVQFLDDRGERMVIPARLVNFKKTDEQNRKIREKAKDPHAIEDDGTLYAKVMRDKEKSDLEKKRTIEYKPTENTSSGTKKEPVIEIPDLPTGNWSTSPEEVEQQFHEVWNKLQTTLPLPPAVWVGLIVLFAILGLVALITEIYLIYNGFQDSLGWGLVLLFFFLGNFFAPIIMSLLPVSAGNGLISALIMLVFALGRFLSVLFYIIVAYCGSKKMVFFLWTAYFWLGLLLALIMVLAALF
ncbi:MAG: hypothetical protein CSA81_03450 [Acidobacteria bacterium]|nr:MAG: hypothetical protein CSA81_03450 [Acidobacteriota bacterium]